MHKKWHMENSPKTGKASSCNCKYQSFNIQHIISRGGLTGIKVDVYEDGCLFICPYYNRVKISVVPANDLEGFPVNNYAGYRKCGKK